MAGRRNRSQVRGTPLPIARCRAYHGSVSGFALRGPQSSSIRYATVWQSAMRRRLITIVLFFLAGAVVNVAVAWWCAASLGFNAGKWDHSAVSGKVAPARRFLVYEQPGYRAVSTVLDSNQESIDYAVGVRKDRIETPVPLAWLTEITDYDPMCESRFDAYGWPVRSLWCGYSFLYQNSQWRVSTFFGAVQLDAFAPSGSAPIWHRHHVLPFRPIWEGVAINSAFNVCILWLFIRGPFALRRAVRLRRCLCPTCAYPMGQAAICTECGRTLPERAVA